MNYVVRKSMRSKFNLKVNLRAHLSYKGHVIRIQPDRHHFSLEVVGTELEGAVQEVPEVAEEF